jgi:6-phosphogluconolactonase/glucosamine-6-phosphate isomerase/deaminase
VMTSGSAKRDLLAQVMGDDHDVARWPAQAALVPNAVWVLDRDAAGGVTPAE